MNDIHSNTAAKAFLTFVMMGTLAPPGQLWEKAHHQKAPTE